MSAGISFDSLTCQLADQMFQKLRLSCGELFHNRGLRADVPGGPRPSDSPDFAVQHQIIEGVLAVVRL